MEQCLLGGVIVGVASSILLRASGQITGVSGIAKGASWMFRLAARGGGGNSVPWKSAFVGGLGTGGVLVYKELLGVPLVSGIGMAPTAMILSGALVGFGTSMSNGCTSGHGVCGIPRLSPRSITAVATFMSTAIATRTILLTNPEVYKSIYPEKFSGLDTVLSKYASIDAIFEPLHLNVSGGALISGSFCMFALYRYFRLKVSNEKENSIEQNSIPNLLVAYMSGIIFSLGLSISGMNDPVKILAFLDFFNVSGKRDFCMIMVMLGAVGFNFVSFRKILSSSKPYFSSKFLVPTNISITPSLVLGSSIFGIGWGLSGLCPGPGLVGLSAGSEFVPWIFGMCLGNMSFFLWQRATSSSISQVMEKKLN